MTFKVWLKGKINDHNRTGDLARDVMTDSDFPDTDSLHTLAVYLESCNACPAALDTLEIAHAEYMRNSPQQRIADILKQQNPLHSLWIPQKKPPPKKT